MIEFHVGPIYTKVTGLDSRDKRYFKDLLSARVKNYQFTPAGRNGWDGYISLFENGKFLTGLMQLITRELDVTKTEYKIKYSYQPENYKLNIDFAKDITLRDYQISAIQFAITLQRGVLKLATNAGKTFVIAGIVNSTGRSALIIVPKVALVKQTAEVLNGLGIPAGQLGGGKADIEHDVIVTTTTSAKKVFHRQFTTLIIDECHHTKAKTIQEAAKKLKSPVRIGLSGTPLSNDKLEDLALIGVTGPVLMEVTNKELIRRGISVKPTVIFHTISKPRVPRSRGYQASYSECVVHNDTRNKKIKDLVVTSDGKTTLILVERIEHINKLLKLIPDALPAHSKLDTQSVLHRLKNEEGSIAIAITAIFGEGVDVAGIENLIIAGSGKSQIRLLQQIGRGLRTGEGKSGVVIHDFMDNCSSYLLNHSETRLETYKNEGFEVEIR